jgi:hypothetical protein
MMEKNIMSPKLSAKIEGNILVLRLNDGLKEAFSLGKRSDLEKTQQVITLASRWLYSNGGRKGQKDAINAALNEDGYYILGPRPGSRRGKIQRVRDQITF